MSNSDRFDNRLEGVIVCLDYGDFLAETLPMNLTHFDRLVVVTSLTDYVTRNVCRKYSVECVTTEAFTERGEIFNKGAAINVGLAALRQRGWILHLDADIVLPQTFVNMLDKSGLQRDCLYGCERACVTGWDNWMKVKSNWFNNPQYFEKYFVHTPAETPISPNVVHKHHGYTPIGFFQLFHSQHFQACELRYPETESNAENMDVQFAIRWPRRKRILLPTVRVFHLDSEAAPMGANWSGRTTKPFTADGNPIQVTSQPGYGYGGYGYSSRS